VTRSLFCVFAAAAGMMCTAADRSGLEAAFGNTIFSTYPDGRTGRLWLQANGEFTAEGRRKEHTSGHWTVKDDKLCMRQSRPIPIPFSFCTPLVSGGIGTTWTAKAVTGEPIQVELMRGGDPANAANVSHQVALAPSPPGTPGAH
jgi:hypothetical protein